MKLKLNRRLLQIGLLCLLLSIILVFFIYSTFKKSVEPEEREKVAYFKYNIDKGKVITKDDIVFKDTPVSLVPENKVTDISQIEGKTLITNGIANDFALSNKFIERGETNIDVADMFQMSLKVDHISNFIGTQIKEGDYYGLLFINQDGFTVDRIFKIKLISMVDSSGRIVTDIGSSVVDTIIFAVDTEEQIKAISSYKKRGYFELFKPSDKYWENFKDTPTFDTLNTLDEVDSSEENDM